MAVMHHDAVGWHEGDAPTHAIENDFVVAHGRGTDDRAIVLVVVHAHAPDAALPLIGVLRAGNRQ